MGEALNQVGQAVLIRALQHARERGIEDIETLLTTGSPTKEILQIAERHQVDTIIVGSRGRGDLEGWLMGSVSHNVSHLAMQTCITVK